MCQLLISGHCALYMCIKGYLYPRNVYSCFVSLIKKRFVFIVCVYERMYACVFRCMCLCADRGQEVRRGHDQMCSITVYLFLWGRDRVCPSTWGSCFVLFCFAGLEVSKLCGPPVSACVWVGVPGVCVGCLTCHVGTGIQTVVLRSSQQGHLTISPAPLWVIV